MTDEDCGVAVLLRNLGLRIRDSGESRERMLGSWREKSAYRPLARLLRLPDVDRGVLGDAVTSTSHRVMAAVFDGDPQPLYDIILDQEADEFIRSRMCEVLAMVTLRGELAREETARFLMGCWNDLKPEQDCYVWHGWQGAIAMLGLAELKSLVERAFERGSIDNMWMRFEHFEQDLQRAIRNNGALPVDSDYTLFGNPIEELSNWYGFSAKYHEDQKRWALEEAGEEAIETGPDLFGKVGRNDPCPCGSGKKFKKCCLDRAPAADTETEVAWPDQLRPGDEVLKRPLLRQLKAGATSLTNLVSEAQ